MFGDITFGCTKYFDYLMFLDLKFRLTGISAIEQGCLNLVDYVSAIEIFRRMGFIALKNSIKQKFK